MDFFKRLGLDIGAKNEAEDEYDDEQEYDYEESDEYEEEDEDEFDEVEYRGSAKVGNSYAQSSPVSARRSTSVSAPVSKPSASSAQANKILNIHATAQLQVIIRKLQTLEEAKEVVDDMIAKRTVVLNLENATKEQGRRIIDFLYGATSAINGNMSKVAAATFIIAPYNVGLIGQDVLGELENNGIFF